MLKKPKPYKKPPPRLVHKSLRIILAERRATEAVREESPLVLSEAVSELDVIQELEPEVDLEIIQYTLTWRVVVGAIPLANTAKRVHIYGGFIYF